MLPQQIFSEKNTSEFLSALESNVYGVACFRFRISDSLILKTMSLPRVYKFPWELKQLLWSDHTRFIFYVQ